MKEERWTEFLQLCHQSKSVKELDEILSFFLTLDEKENIIDRYLITEALLKNELPQRQMAQVLNVSIAKITRGSNALKMMPGHLKKLLLSFFPH